MTWFEWDPEKARSNLRKHGISFAIAQHVFSDPDAFSEGDRMEGIWGKFDLPPGQHTVQVLIQGKPYSGSKGSWVYVKDLVVYRK